MRIGKLKHWLKYQIGCSDKEWDTRQKVITLLENAHYTVNKESPNPLRLYASEQDNEVLIDVWGTHTIGVLPNNDHSSKTCLEVKALIASQFSVAH